jgi:tripartite-type tricarboxylate transporter receptor subunit TctC
LIGVAVGGDYDVQGRFLSRHIGRHIPGNPTVLPENMTGAGGLKMTNYLYELAPKNGTYIGIIPNNFPALQASGGQGVQFDSAKFQWLGAMTRETNTMVVWHTTGVKTVEDMRRTEVVAGASGRGAITYTFPAMMNELLGTKFKIVTGYAGGNEINLAMERGEVGARINSWTSWKVTRPDWLRDKKIVIIAQGGRRSPELADIPSVEDLARNDDDRQVIQMLMSGSSLGRPFAMPPGVSPQQIGVLRTAFTDMMKDPVVLAEAAAAKMELDPLSGDEMQAMIETLLKTPKPIAERARDFLQ